MPKDFIKVNNDCKTVIFLFHISNSSPIPSSLVLIETLNKVADAVFKPVVLKVW
jgi:hypothetical protein